VNQLAFFKCIHLLFETAPEARGFSDEAGYFFCVETTGMQLRVEQ
jgi:hypothetical protein